MIALIIVAGALVALPWLAVALDEWFSPKWDSIYDPRSNYQKWKDQRHQ